MRNIPKYMSIVAFYGVASVIWVLLINPLVHTAVVRGTFHFRVEQIVHGAFILMTSITLYLTLRSHHIKRVAAKKQLRSNERSFRAIFFKNPQPMWVWDHTTDTFLAINNAAMRLYGYSRRAFRQMRLAELYPTQQVQKRQFLSADGTPKSYAADEIHQTQNGQLIEVQFHAYPITFSGKSAIIMTVVDMTAQRKASRTLDQYRKRLELLVQNRTKELETANAELRVLTKLKDDFVSNVSHELRTPITSIKLQQRLIMLQPETAEKRLQTIGREVDRLAHIINDLLFLSRLDQGRYTFSPEAISILHLAEQYTADRKTIAAQKGLALNIHADTCPANAIILGDRSLLEQALGVLIANAIAYTPEGGTVTITLQEKSSQEQTYCGISVNDTGPGIHPAEHEKIFERFYRGTQSKTTPTPGTGLGLAIAHQITEQHGGHITVESTLEQGATFTLWLPQAANAEQNMSA